MYVDGQLKQAQLEELSSSSPTPAARGRVYSQLISSKGFPTIYDGSRYLFVRTSDVFRRSVTTTATVNAEDEMISCDATGAAFAITLPQVSAYKGRVIILKKIDASFANAVTITAHSGDTIKGSSAYKLNTQFEAVTIQSDGGTDWVVLGHYIDTAWNSVTMSASTWVSNTVFLAKMRRVGGSAQFQIQASLSGAPTAATLGYTLPTGLTIDASQLVDPSTGGILPFSHGQVFDTSAGDNYIGLVGTYTTSTSVSVYAPLVSSTVVKRQAVTNTVPMTFATGDNVNFSFQVPILGWTG